MLRNLFFFIFLPLSLLGNDYLVLRDNLQLAKKGDFIVTAQNRSYSILHIFDRDQNHLIIEEITVPEKNVQAKTVQWADWVKQGAPGNSSWILYDLNLKTAAMENMFSFTHNKWVNLSPEENFFTTLLNLRFRKIPAHERKRIPRRATFWAPPLIYQGKKVEGASFDAWYTVWPKDCSEMSEKLVEVYTPEARQEYPSYFPYWVQVSGSVFKAQVRIIDSGRGLKSPKPGLPKKVS